MIRRELLIGGGLAAVLVAGFLWTRGAGEGHAAPVSLDLSQGDGEFLVEDISVTAAATPRPLRVFERLHLSFRFARGEEEVSVTEPRIDFHMTMDMGPHGYRLMRDETGAWIADDVVLPQCGSGSRLWFGELAFTVADQPRTARLRMELDPPRTD